MTKLARFIVFISILTSALHAQDKQLHLKDSQTHHPIPGAFYALDTLQFGSSDVEGRIKLTALPTAEGILTISHLSYRDTSITIPAASDGPIELLLEPARIDLPEISISGKRSRRFRSPEHLLRMALKAVDDNYAQKAVSRTALYREQILYDTCLVNLNEALLDMELGPYDRKFRLRASWKEGWDRHFGSFQTASRGVNRAMGYENPEGTQQYVEEGDLYRVKQSRVSLAESPHDFYTPFRDGPLTLVALDKVRFGYDYLSPKHLKEYSYTLVDSVFANGVYCYRLRFRPANDKPTRRFTLNKQQSVGAFTGELFIDQQSLAIVRYTAVNSKDIVQNGNGQAPGTRLLPTGYAETTVNYVRRSTGLWELETVTSRVRSPAKPEYSAWRTLYLTDQQLQLPTLADSRWRYFNFQWTLHKLTHGYREDFWSAFVNSNFYRRARLSGPTCRIGLTPKDIAFSRPFTVDEVKTPRARPMRDLAYVPDRRIRQPFEWLAERTDSATTAYLKWENDYYEQYFRSQLDAMELAATQFSRQALGYGEWNEQTTTTTDTLLRKLDGQLGFYRIIADRDTQLLLPIDTATVGYTFTDYGWTKGARLFYVLSDHPNYDRLLQVYDHQGLKFTQPNIDEYKWSGETLYVTTLNDKLRTSGFKKWSPETGWHHQLTENDPAFEFALYRLPDDSVVLARLSMTEASLVSLGDQDNQDTAQPTSPLEIGTGPYGTGCLQMGTNFPLDYLVDCRQSPTGTTLIAADSARHELWIQSAATKQWHQLTLPQGTHLVTFIDSDTTDTTVVELEGVATYGQTYRIDFTNQQLLPTADQPTYAAQLSGFRDSIVWVPSSDGTPIPSQIRWRSEGENAYRGRGTLLRIYSAYGNPYLIGYSEADIALMNLGFAVAYVHARGGGARGMQWYNAGRAQNKVVAIRDVIATARYFNSVQHPLGQSPIYGYAQSAGGPLLGQAINIAPQLWQAIIFDHAFLDVTGLMSRPDLPLTEYEYLEWGDPRDKQVRKFQLRYSPYQNIVDQKYPPMLLQAGWYDQSTPYWQIAKYVAALRHATGGAADIRFHTDFRGSHPGTPFHRAQRELVQQLAFLLGH